MTKEREGSNNLYIWKDNTLGENKSQLEMYKYAVEIIVSSF